MTQDELEALPVGVIFADSDVGNIPPLGEHFRKLSDIAILSLVDSAIMEVERFVDPGEEYVVVAWPLPADPAELAEYRRLDSAIFDSDSDSGSA